MNDPETNETLPSYTSDSPADWSMIPPRMIGGLRRYIEHGIPPGHFLTAVLCNDLVGAFDRADEENQRIMINYIRFLYNYAPTGCWHSPQNFKDWCERGGLKGYKQ